MEGDKKNMRFTEIFPRTMVCVMGYTADHIAPSAPRRHPTTEFCQMYARARLKVPSIKRLGLVT